jgi:hypothetical protein
MKIKEKIRAWQGRDMIIFRYTRKILDAVLSIKEFGKKAKIERSYMREGERLFYGKAEGRVRLGPMAYRNLIRKLRYNT